MDLAVNTKPIEAQTVHKEDKPDKSNALKKTNHGSCPAHRI